MLIEGLKKKIHIEKNDEEFEEMNQYIKSHKKYKKDEWDEIYSKRFMKFEKEVKNKHQKQREEKSKMQAIEEDQVMEFIEKAPKADKETIKKVVERMYDDAMRRKLGTASMRVKSELTDHQKSKEETSPIMKKANPKQKLQEKRDESKKNRENRELRDSRNFNENKMRSQSIKEKENRPKLIKVLSSSKGFEKTSSGQNSLNSSKQLNKTDYLNSERNKRANMEPNNRSRDENVIMKNRSLSYSDRFTEDPLLKNLTKSKTMEENEANGVDAGVNLHSISPVLTNPNIAQFTSLNQNKSSKTFNVGSSASATSLVNQTKINQFYFPNSISEEHDLITEIEDSNIKTSDIKISKKTLNPKNSVGKFVSEIAAPKIIDELFEDN